MKRWYPLLRMVLEMASELKDFLATLEPVWEDPNEFNWLRKIKISSLKKQHNIGFQIK